MATIRKNENGTLALAAFDDSAELQKHEIGRPAPGANDVQIDIKYCGMCHSDLHAVNGDLGMDAFPMAPGHEIADIVKAVGDKVTEYKKGDRVTAAIAKSATTENKTIAPSKVSAERVYKALEV